MTLDEIINDLKKLAEFMGWPFEGEERTITGRFWSPSTTTVSLSAEEATLERYQRERRSLMAQWEKSAHNKLKWQTHANFIRECAREALGIKGRTAKEVQKLCLEAHPDLYMSHETFAEIGEAKIALIEVASEKRDAIAS